MSRLPIVLSSSALLLAAATSASAVDVSLSGQTDGDEFGWAAEMAGDVGGDGAPDLLVGAPTNAAVADYAGRAYLFEGPVTSNRTANHADATFSGEAFGDNLGVAVAGGDLNGDGLADVVLGARSNDGAGTQAGRVYVFFAPVQKNEAAADADVTISGTAFDELGWRVLVADFNGDQVDDLLLGAPNAAGAGFISGEAALFYGPLSGALSITDADARFLGLLDSEEIGQALGAGDLNHDGIPDIVLGGPRFPLNGTDTGRTYVFFGPVTGSHVVTTADVILLGEAQDDAFGASVASDDVDGDGVDDLVVGADQQFLATGAGKAYLFPGPLATGSHSAATAVAVLTGEAAGDQFGESVAIVPGGGRVAVGAPAQGGGGASAGRAYLFTGPLSGTVPASSAAQTVTGAAGDQLGHVVSAGDVDGTDGDDLLIGFPASSAASPGGVDALFGTVPTAVGLVGSGLADLGLRVLPNPTRGPATVTFGLPRPARVAVDVVDVTGRRVRRLDVGERAAGEHALAWDGRDDGGRSVPAGVYFIRLRTGGDVASRRVVRID